MFNLFLSVKSYSNNIKFVPYSVLIVIKEEKSFIAHNFDVNIFKKISYLSFVSWFIRQLDDDRTYLKKNNLYSIVFTYVTNFYDEGSLYFLKPKYPWNSEILRNYVAELDENKKYIEIIENQSKEIIKLKKQIMQLLDGKNK